MITRSMFILASLAGTLFITPVFAQSAEGVLEEITVTAERREGSLQEVPIAITAMSMEKLGNLQITEARDLQRYVPSLNMFNNIVSTNNLSLSLRGGLQQDASLVVAESPIGIYIDGVYSGRMNGNDITLSDIERVEVLRGPQGTLYGRNTGYGAISFISRTPDSETSWFDTTVGVGNFDQFLLSASLGGPLSDNWAGSLSGRFKTKDGIFYNTTTNEDTDLQEVMSLRGKLHYTGGDRFDAVLSVAYSDANNDGLQLVNGITPNVLGECPCPAGVTAQFTTEDLVFPAGEYNVTQAWGQAGPAPQGTRPNGKFDQTVIGLTLTYDIRDNLTFRSITGFVDMTDNWHTDLKGDGGGFVGATIASSEQFTQEIQFIGTAMDDRLTYLAGAFYLREEADQMFGWSFIFPLSQSVFSVETDSLALYGDVSYQIDDNWKITGGMRFTDEEKDFVMDYERLAGNLFDLVIGPGGLFPPVKNHIELGHQGEEWTPRVVLEYSFTDLDLMVYGSAAKGLKGGGFSAIALLSTAPVSVYDPEANWTFEGGMKAEWLDNRLRTNLAYFFSDIEDIQQNATDPTGPGLEFPVQNSGDAEIQGLEFEISFVPIEGLNLFMSGALMDGKYTRLNAASAAAASIPQLGLDWPDTPQTPDYAINVGFDYTVDLPMDGLGDLSFGLDYYEIDDYITAAAQDFHNSGWDVWNGFVSVDVGDHWELKVTGKNLGDDLQISSGSRGLGGFVFLPPRQVMFMATYRM